MKHFLYLYFLAVLCLPLFAAKLIIDSLDSPDHTDLEVNKCVNIPDSCFIELRTLTLEITFNNASSSNGFYVAFGNDTDTGRPLSTRYSDGTFTTNTWDCCRITQTTARDGAITAYTEWPGYPNQSEVVYISQASLPGAAGKCPGIYTYNDPIGRQYQSIRFVTDANFNYNSDYEMQTTETIYPYGTSNYRVTTDHLDIATTNSIYRGSTYTKETTRSRGIESRTTRKAGGGSTTYKTWIDPVSNQRYTVETKTESEINPDGCETSTSYVRYDYDAWITQSETVSDFLGRTVSTTTPLSTSSNVYDSVGRLMRNIAMDGSSNVTAYNELGERTASIRIAAGQSLDFDPLGFTLASVIALDKYLISLTTEGTENTEGEWWNCSANVFYAPGENARTTSVLRVQLTGLTPECTSKSISTDANKNTTVNWTAVDAANARRVSTSINVALGLTNVSHSVAGYVITSSNALGAVTGHLYDGYSRKVKTTNIANGRELKSVTTYHDDGSLATRGQITETGTNTTSYSSRQAVAEKPGAYKIVVTDALKNATTNYYSGSGQLYRSEGATYPTETVRDASGHMTELHTWRDESGNPDVTTWQYDQVTGLLTNKVYADENGTSYSYHNDGKIATRTWARGIITSYDEQNTATGSVHTVDYNDNTPDVTTTRNLVGQTLSIQDDTGTTTFGYDSKGRQTAETNALAIIIRSFDTLGRYTGYELFNPVDTVNPIQKITYGFDDYGRFTSVTSVIGIETNIFTYTYLPGTSINTGYTGTSSINNYQLSIINSYEPDRNLISSVSNTFVYSVPSVVSSFNYTNDTIGRRTKRADYFNASTITNDFAYNIRSEVTNAVMNADTYSYVFDDIGNREQSKIDNGQLITTNVYSSNELNQYTNILNSQLSIIHSHDLDGNLTFDGSKWDHSWDGENRLIKSEPHNATNGSVMVECKYNYKNLRVSKIFKQLSGRGSGYPMDPSQPGTWNIIETRKYIWDGWHIAAEIIIDEVTPATNISYYAWGLDLSGSLQDAGGVGGLLSETKTTSSATNTYFALSDANGNITEYLDDSGSTVAHGEHNAFGETKLFGSMKDEFTHWFSTKPYDPETRLVQYQFRPYDAPNGHWLSRDPIEERDGVSLYGLGNNDLINKWDYLGLKDVGYLYACGRSLGTKIIKAAPASMKSVVAKYQPPEGAKCKCTLTIKTLTSSTYLRDATSKFDKIFFLGHGEVENRQRAGWKQGDSLLDRYYTRTKIVFSDGSKFLKNILTGNKKRTVTTEIIPLVCYDAYCDKENELDIMITPALNNKKKNNAFFNVLFMDKIIEQFKLEKCKTINVNEG